MIIKKLAILAALFVGAGSLGYAVTMPNLELEPWRLPLLWASVNQGAPDYERTDDYRRINEFPDSGAISVSQSKASIIEFYNFTESEFSLSWLAIAGDKQLAEIKNVIWFTSPVDIRYDMELAGFVSADRCISWTSLSYKLGNNMPVWPTGEQFRNDGDEDGPLIAYSFAISGLLPANAIMLLEQRVEVTGRDSGEIPSFSTGSWRVKFSAVPETGTTLSYLFLSGIGFLLVRRLK